jgi:putative transposase
MTVDPDTRHGPHRVFATHVQVVFVTKYRRPVLGAAHLRHLEAVFEQVSADFEAQLVEFNGETDHAHLHITHPPTVAVSNLLNTLNGVSARITRHDHPDPSRRSWSGHPWSPSYLAGSPAGTPMSVLRHFIEEQPRPVEAEPRTPIPPRPEGQGISAKGLP